MNKNVLIIDDQESILKMIKRNLQDNYNVFTTTLPQKCNDIIENENIDVVVLDQMMPDITGLELLKRIKYKFDIPVVMMTAYGSKHLAIEFMKLGGSDFIEKPLDFLILEIKIKNALKLHESKIKNQMLVSKNDVKKRLKALWSLYSHRLNTDLNIIIGLAQVASLQMKNENYENSQESIDNILNYAPNLEHLIGTMLQLLTLDEDELMLKKEIITINKIVDEKLKNISNDIEINISGKEVVSNHVGVRYLIEELLENSIKFTKSGKIEIEIDEDENNIYFSVKDTGIGINQENISQVTKLHFREDSSGSYSGLGYGLFMVKNLVELNNGKLKIYSLKNEKTTVNIILPK